MPLKTILLLVLIFALSCNNSQTTNDTKFDGLQTKIIGLWGGLGEDSPVWQIKKDSIYYFEEKKSYACRLDDGSLSINYNGRTFFLKDISVIEDTLIFYDEHNIKTFAYRFRNN